MDALLMQLHGHRLGIVATNAYERIEFVLGKVIDATVNTSFALGWIGARSLENGASTGKDSGDRFQVQRHPMVFHYAAPSFHEPNERVVIMKDAFTHHSSNYCIQSWAITTAG